MRSLKVYFYILRLCLKSLRRLNLGDIVILDGERYMLTQGVCDPYWNMHHVVTNARLENVNRARFKKERSIRNAVHDVRSTWRFYMGYWFDIWVHDHKLMRDWSHQP